MRGTGLMIGVDMHDADLAAEIQKRMMFERHILLNRTSETVLRFLPPFLITRAQVDETVSALASLLTKAEHTQTKGHAAAQAEEALHG